MKPSRKLRRLLVTLGIAAFAVVVAQWPHIELPQASSPAVEPVITAHGDAATTLNELEVKGRASKTGYERDLFGDGWDSKQGCDTRNFILKRDLINTVIDERCRVISGSLNDPYTGTTVMFERGETTSSEIQIDHVVALSDAWQKGAQQLSQQRRQVMANDPLELLAVDGLTNQQKSDADAATWLPSNKDFRCQYVARQVTVKKKYTLWVTPAEKKAILQVLAGCPGEPLPVQ